MTTFIERWIAKQDARWNGTKSAYRCAVCNLPHSRPKIIETSKPSLLTRLLEPAWHLKVVCSRCLLDLNAKHSERERPFGGRICP